MFTRILVPTDFSPGADAALAVARSVADRFGASLYLVHVLDDPFTAVMMSAESFIPDLPALREAMMKEATKELETRLSERDRTTLHARSEAFFGAGARSIVEYATGHDIELIVMGTHGRTGIAHLLLGSVAERVVQTAPCAVLTVRESAGITTPAAADTAAAAA